MVRQAHHERLNLPRLKLVALNLSIGYFLAGYLQSVLPSCQGVMP